MPVHLLQYIQRKKCKWSETRISQKLSPKLITIRLICRPGKAPTISTALKAVVPIQETPFSTKKDSEGNFRKIIQRVFLVGLAGACARRRWGRACTGSAFTLEMGSSFGVNCRQFTQSAKALFLFTAIFCKLPISVKFTSLKSL